MILGEKEKRRKGEKGGMRNELSSFSLIILRLQNMAPN